MSSFSSISPLKFCCDFRPYFTIHDSEFREYTTRTQAPWVTHIWTHHDSPDHNSAQLTTPGLTGPHVHTPDYLWVHQDPPDHTWTQLTMPGLTWADQDPPDPTCTHLHNEHTRTQLDSSVHVTSPVCRPNVVLGVTNPFFVKTFQNWPHIVRLGEIKMAGNKTMTSSFDSKWECYHYSQMWEEVMWFLFFRWFT